MKESFNAKILWVLTIAICALFIAITFTSVMGEPLFNRNFTRKEKEHIISLTNDHPKPPSSRISPFRQVLKPNDEGSHQKTLLLYQEWWYFNVIFNESDSELRNWSLMISFNQMKIGDIFFFTLYDEKNKSYGGKITMPRGTIRASGPGVNVEFNNSYAIGAYPNWHIYAEDEDLSEHEITVDLIYKANSLPLWTIINTGHNISKSPAGHYLIINCDVTGEIKINETVYTVHGIGYQEHSWAYISQRQGPGLIINIWDYFCIHFDNGWDMLAGKIYPLYPFMRYIPNILMITPDGENITEGHFYRVEYLETENTSVPGVNIPTKIHINVLILNTIFTNPLEGPVYVDINIETTNIHEYIWGSPPYAGIWEGPIKANGTIKWSKNNIELNGWGMTELIRAAS